MTSSRPLGRWNLAAILRTVLQASYEKQECFSALSACASVLLIEKSLLLIEELSLPSSNLSHRISGKVGFRLFFFPSPLWTTVSKTNTGCSSLINSISRAMKICVVTLQPKAGASVLPPESTQSWVADIQGNNPSLHLHWTFPPNSTLLIQVFFSFWIWLAGSGSYLLLFALHFTCDFKYAAVTQFFLLRELDNTCRLSWSCSLTFSFCYCSAWKALGMLIIIVA